MSENLAQSLTYSLGLIHGTKNVLKRILKSINEMNPAAGGKRLVDFADLIGSLNETLVIQENGKFIFDRDGEIIFDWIQERRDLVIAHIKNAEL